MKFLDSVNSIIDKLEQAVNDPDYLDDCNDRITIDGNACQLCLEIRNAHIDSIDTNCFLIDIESMLNEEEKESIETLFKAMEDALTSYDIKIDSAYFYAMGWVEIIFNKEIDEDSEIPVKVIDDFMKSRSIVADMTFSQSAIIKIDENNI